MATKAKQIFYDDSVEKELRKQAADLQISLAQHITNILTEKAGVTDNLLNK